MVMAPPVSSIPSGGGVVVAPPVHSIPWEGVVVAPPVSSGFPWAVGWSWRHQLAASSPGRWGGHAATSHKAAPGFIHPSSFILLRGRQFKDRVMAQHAVSICQIPAKQWLSSASQGASSRPRVGSNSTAVSGIGGQNIT